MIPVIDKPGRPDRSEHAREIRRALIGRLRPSSRPAPRASTLVVVLTAAAMVAGLFVWIAARQLGGTP